MRKCTTATVRRDFACHFNPSAVIAKFHRTDTDTDTDFLADYRARILARKSACPARAAAGRSAALAARSVGQTFVRTRAFPREDVRC